MPDMTRRLVLVEYTADDGQVQQELVSPEFVVALENSGAAKELAEQTLVCGRPSQTNVSSIRGCFRTLPVERFASRDSGPARICDECERHREASVRRLSRLIEEFLEDDLLGRDWVVNNMIPRRIERLQEGKTP